jgi:hypothetical protein
LFKSGGGQVKGTIARIASFDKEAQKVLYMKALPWWMHDRIVNLEVAPKNIPSLTAKALHYDLLSKQRQQGQRPNNNLYTVPAHRDNLPLGTRNNPIHVERHRLSTEEVNKMLQQKLLWIAVPQEI